jgi:hypothetical protein
MTPSPAYNALRRAGYAKVRRGLWLPADIVAQIHALAAQHEPKVESIKARATHQKLTHVRIARNQT